VTVAPLIDLDASLARVRDQYNSHVMQKLPEDLDRYVTVIAADRPDVLVECGTGRGGSACWFAAQGVEVVTIDIADRAAEVKGCSPQVTWLVGDSADPALAGMVAGMVVGRRVMVVLDSDHAAGHVAAEIVRYGPLVSPGCHLVVEDGITRWMPGEPPGPLDAIELLLDGDPRWARDSKTEQLSPVSMYPGGWWVRRA
jgi:cephalosporin hydroxylase